MPLVVANDTDGRIAGAEEYLLNRSENQAQAFLTSLDVELPEGGVEYLFRTPRGDLEISAYSVSSPLLERGIRLAIVLVVALVVVVPLRRLSRRWDAA